MEQARYWMWTRTTNYSSRPHLRAHQIPAGLLVGSSYNESWEEKAFAEDTAGHLGGCVWPPRSYSCSFCRREFRSAQALGGHMNVHRRDRARLKQSSSLDGEDNEEQQHPNPFGVMVVGKEYQPQVSLGTLANPNPNPNSGALSSPLSPRISAPITSKEYWAHGTLVSPYISSSITRDKNLMESLLSKTRSLEEDSTPLQLFIVPEPKLGGDSLGSRGNGLWRWRSDPGVYDEETNCNKRRRTESRAADLIFLRNSSGEQQQDRSDQVLNHNPVEELDLELRLGDAPKIR